MEIDIMKPEPKWIGYSIIIGGIIMFSGIFLHLYIDLNWWILPLLGALILFVPWLIIWKPKKGKLTLNYNYLKINYESELPFHINLNEIIEIKTKFKHFDGQLEGIIGILSSAWPFYSGYENIVTVFTNTVSFKFGVYAENKIQLKNIATKFELIQDQMTDK